MFSEISVKSSNPTTEMSSGISICIARRCMMTRKAILSLAHKMTLGLFLEDISSDSSARSHDLISSGVFLLAGLIQLGLIVIPPSCMARVKPRSLRSVAIMPSGRVM